MPRIIFRGTIGDTFLNLIKISNLENINDYELVRVSKHEINSDTLNYLTTIFNIDKKINYINDNDFLINEITNDDIYFENSELSNFQIDKQLFLKSKDIFKSNILKIGIQIDAGSHQGNYRYMNFNWIKNLIHDFYSYDNKRFTFIILGNSKFDTNFNKKYSIKNLSGQLSFQDWSKEIIDLNFLISLEGLPVFLALANSIPVFMINQYIDNLDNSIHPSWQKNLKTFNCNQMPFYKLKKKLMFYFKFKNVIKPSIKNKSIIDFLIKFYEK